MNSCMWAAAHLSKDEDDFKRIIQNMELQKIQTIFETVQAQVSKRRTKEKLSWWTRRKQTALFLVLQKYTFPADEHPSLFVFQDNDAVIKMIKTG